MKYFLTLSWVERKWRLPLFIAGGLAAALALLVVRISNAASYLSNEAEVCLNCHVMRNGYDTWRRGSHGRVAVCGDCHVPHTNPVAKTAFKASDGMRHAWVFTRRAEPQVLRLNSAAVKVVQSNCERCHLNQFQMIRLAHSTERTCWSCHRNVHGDVHSLSASAQNQRPPLPPAGLKKKKRSQ